MPAKRLACARVSRSFWKRRTASSWRISSSVIRAVSRISSGIVTFMLGSLPILYHSGRRSSVPGLAQVRRLQRAVGPGHVGRGGAAAGGFEAAELEPVFGEAAEVGLEAVVGFAAADLV